jgi:hypothetical protein
VSARCSQLTQTMEEAAPRSELTQLKAPCFCFVVATERRVLRPALIPPSTTARLDYKLAP